MIGDYSFEKFRQRLILKFAWFIQSQYRQYELMCNHVDSVNGRSEEEKNLRWRNPYF